MFQYQIVVKQPHPVTLLGILEELFLSQIFFSEKYVRRSVYLPYLYNFRGLVKYIENKN